MPRVTFVKKARKDIGDIKKGESYYWWKFRNGGKRTSKTPPKPSQLTQSEYYGFVYGLQESNAETPNFDDIEGQIESIKDEIQGHKDEIDDKISNLESVFPNGCPSLELLQERSESLDSCISELDSIDTSVDTGEAEEGSDEEQETKDQRASEIWEEVTAALSNIS